MGIDIDSILSNAAQSAEKYIDLYLDDIQCDDNESKGLILTKGKNGYYLVKTKFDSQAKEHLTNLGCIKLDEAINNIVKQISNE